jgi:hypothetical protein
MGYDLRITRRKDWCDEGCDITTDEWPAYIATDPQLRLDPSSTRHGVIMDIKCQYPDLWLEWWEGCIYAKNPDERILTKMLQIASALQAKVQGDDGEVYRSANFEDYYHED